MPQLNGQSGHIDAALSNYAVMAFDSGADGMNFVGEKICPAIGVTNQSNRYFVLEPGSFFIEDGQAAKRAPQTEAKRVIYSVSSDGYFCDNYALQHAWGQEEIANMDPAVRGQQAVDLIVGKLRRGQEVRIANLLTSITNIGSGVALTGSNKWSDLAGSDPIGDIDSGHAFIRRATGLKANTLVVDADTMTLLRRHPVLLDMYKYTSGGTVADTQIANAFRVENILEAGGLKNNANQGQAKSLVNIWGNSAVLLYNPPSAGSFNAPSAGAVRFQWNNNGIYPGTFGVERTMLQGAGSIHSEVIETGHFQAEKVVARDLIYAVTATL
jgi:hypothetical protein